MTVSTGLQRAEGASAEHYALCRCGQSRNKPFCSGMHWYAGFRDPVPDAAREPTPFEWAGGLRRRPGAAGRGGAGAARAGRAGEFRRAHQAAVPRRDRQSMSFAFDLWSYDDVRAQAAGISPAARGRQHAV
ncbi:MAG: CDGSH iron-sulfur domain-containing protein [Streptosporangiaceae bacterium]